MTPPAPCNPVNSTLAAGLVCALSISPRTQLGGLKLTQACHSLLKLRKKKGSDALSGHFAQLGLEMR